MKYFISLLFFSILFQANSQLRLEGKYCLDTKETKSMFGKYAFECIHLKLDGSFSYLFKNPVDEIKGFGTYKLNKKKLKLTIRYYADGDITKSLISKKEHPLKETETAFVSVKLYNLQDSIEMNDMIIILIDSLKEKASNQISIIITDSLGNSEFEVQDANMLTILSVYFEKPQIPISNKFHTELIIYLDKDDTHNKYLSSKDNLTYRIKDLEDNQFLLKKRKEKIFKKYVVK
jgi:hypothetical protein